MTDFPGTQPSFVQLVDDSAPGAGDGDAYEANQINVAYNEIEALAAHVGAGTSIASGGGQRLTLAQGGNDAGYSGEAAIYAGAGTPIVIVPAGAWDVAVGMIVTGIVVASDGQVQAGTTYILNGETKAVFDDGEGGNVYDLTVAAGGEASCVRASGSLTYRCLFRMLWF